MTSAFNRRFVLVRAVAALAATVVASVFPQSPEASDRAPVEHVVEISGFKFVPASLSVQPGDTVTWINRDIVPHTATAKDESWDTALIEKGESRSVLVTSDLGSDYFCLFHPRMTGRIEVILNE